MKKSIIFFASLILLACDRVPEIEITDAVSPIGDDNSELFNFVDGLKDYSALQLSINGEQKNMLGDSVLLYDELVNLFNPDNFDCGCKGKLKDKIKNMKREERDKSGFIPEIVIQNAFYNEDVIKLEDNAGVNVLAHSFQYGLSDGEKSGMIFAEDAPTKSDFDVMTYIDIDEATYPNFLYTLDCSGYISAAIAASAGFDKASVKASTEGAASRETSIFIVGGVMNTPLYEAFIGRGEFSSVDSATLVKRIKELEAITRELEVDNNVKDTTPIYLNVNYQLIFASNQGKSNFNGKAELKASGNASVGVGSGSTNVNAGVEIKSESSFSNYATYIANINLRKVTPSINYLDVAQRIDSLKGVLNEEYPNS